MPLHNSSKERSHTLHSGIARTRTAPSNTNVHFAGSLIDRRAPVFKARKKEMSVVLKKSIKCSFSMPPPVHPNKVKRNIQNLSHRSSMNSPTLDPTHFLQLLYLCVPKTLDEILGILNVNTTMPLPNSIRV